MDGVFLAVTQLTGAVKLVKMPSVLNPLEKDQSQADLPAVGSRDSNSKPVTAQKNQPPERMSQEMGSMHSMGVTSDQEHQIILKNDLEKFEYSELVLA